MLYRHCCPTGKVNLDNGGGLVNAAGQWFLRSSSPHAAPWTVVLKKQTEKTAAVSHIPRNEAFHS